MYLFARHCWQSYTIDTRRSRLAENSHPTVLFFLYFCCCCRLLFSLNRFYFYLNAMNEHIIYINTLYTQMHTSFVHKSLHNILYMNRNNFFFVVFIELKRHLASVALAHANSIIGHMPNACRIESVHSFQLSPNLTLPFSFSSTHTRTFAHNIFPLLCCRWSYHDIIQTQTPHMNT